MNKLLTDIAKEIGRRVGPLALRLWPALVNPAWNAPKAARTVLGPALAVSIDPAHIQLKIGADGQRAIKGRFLVDEFSKWPRDRIRELYTFQDMEDIARHGEDFRATRLYAWLEAGLSAKRPVAGRGQIFNSEEKIEAYCRGYLDMFRSMQQIGYRYEGEDEICIGLGQDGDIVHVRRGTHRIAAAQILGLPRINARITHISRGFARAAEERFSGGTIKALKQAIHEITG